MAISNIHDLVTVAIAFGSKPGSPNWNPIADLDKNDIINIMDVIIVARNYGKTV